MEEAAGKKKQLQAPTGSTSSIVDELFGPKDAAAGSSSAAGYFSTVFPPPSAGTGKDASRRAHGQGSGSMSGKQPQHGSSATADQSPYFGSSSVHYGGRDFYAAASSQQSPAASSKQFHPSEATDQTAAPAPKTTRDDGKGSPAATRGDWWQGSLYY